MYVHDPNLGSFLKEHWASSATLEASPIEDLPQVLGAERRQEPRYATDEAASVHSLNPLIPEYIPARIVDVSTRGLRLRIGRPIQPGTEIQIKSNLVFVVGEIRYCIHIGTSFLAGVLVDDVFWSRDSSPPPSSRPKFSK